MSFYFTDNRQIPSDLQNDAIPIQKTLDWDDEGADGNYVLTLTKFI